MKYSLFKIPFCSNKPEKPILFESNLVASNLYKIDKLGFLILFKDAHCIGLINDKNEFKCPWLGTPNVSGFISGMGSSALMNYPSSLCYSKNSESCYLIERGGSRIRKLDVKSAYLSSVFGNVLDKKMDKYVSHLKSLGDAVTDCCIGNNETIYWCVSDLNRCFEFNSSNITELVGNGRNGYSVANVLTSCCMSYPCGIAFSNDSIYIADNGNQCIRMVNQEHISVIAGNPQKNTGESPLTGPYNLRSNKKLLYFLDGGKVKCLSLRDQKVVTIYDSQKIISIDCDDYNNLFVMEMA